MMACFALDEHEQIVRARDAMNREPITFIRRLGDDGAPRCLVEKCPAIFETNQGFVVIGRDVTDETRGNLPAGSGCADDERVVVIPRSLMLTAASELSALTA